MYRVLGPVLNASDLVFKTNPWSCCGASGWNTTTHEVDGEPECHLTPKPRLPVICYEPPKSIE